MRKVVILFVLILFSLQFISAVEFDMKTNFSQGESFIAKVSGDFAQPLTEQDVIFFRRHMQTSIIPKIVRINDDYYIYASLDEKIPDDYSININEDSKNFTIDSETADFSINKGFIITDKDFSIDITNLKNSKTLINTNFSSKSSSFFFESNEMRQITFGIGDIKQTSLQILEMKTENLEYKIPVYVFVKEQEIEEENTTPQNISGNKSEEIINTSKSEKIISVSTKQTCAEMNKSVCVQNLEICDGESSYGKDNLCCSGICKEIPKNSTWKILGWSLLVIIILIIWFVRNKYYSVKSEVNLFGKKK
ncbi:MAG: hypothetical protein Q8P15_01155 [Nanoarchaeota archaeon]|nr:hypothetical protein [Nanoarchaeota archaeon]